MLTLSTALTQMTWLLPALLLLVASVATLVPVAALLRQPVPAWQRD